VHDTSDKAAIVIKINFFIIYLFLIRYVNIQKKVQTKKSGLNYFKKLRTF